MSQVEAEEQSKHLFRLRLQKHWAIYRHNVKLSTCVRLRSAYGNLTKDHRTIHVYLLCMIIVPKLGQIMIVNVVDRKLLLVLSNSTLEDTYAHLISISPKPRDIFTEI